MRSVRAGYGMEEDVNIYKLEKQATPGKWMVGASMGIHVNDGKPYIAQFLNKRTDAEYQANARLAAHWRNNFMRLLEALKMCVNSPRIMDTSSEVEKLSDLIAEMEEVKT